eukprot:433759-Rhodomonas_salina.5
MMPRKGESGTGERVLPHDLLPRSAGKEYAAKPPPSPSDLASLADFLAPTPLPPSLSELLRLHDGGILLFEFTGLSVAEITQAVTDGRKEDKWAAGIVPVARNPDGELL